MQATNGAEVARIIARIIPSDAATGSSVRSPSASSQVSSPRSVFSPADADAASPSRALAAPLLSIDDIVAAVDASLPVDEQRRDSARSDRAAAPPRSYQSGAALVTSPLARVYNFATGFLGAGASGSVARENATNRDRPMLSERLDTVALPSGPLDAGGLVATPDSAPTRRAPPAPLRHGDATESSVIVRTLLVSEHPPIASMFSKHSEWLPARRSASSQAALAPLEGVRSRGSKSPTSRAKASDFADLRPRRRRRDSAAARCRGARRPASAPRPLLVDSFPVPSSEDPSFDAVAALSTDTDVPPLNVRYSSQATARDCCGAEQTPRSDTSSLSTAHARRRGRHPLIHRPVPGESTVGGSRPFESEPPPVRRNCRSVSQAGGVRDLLLPRHPGRRRVSRQAADAAATTARATATPGDDGHVQRGLAVQWSPRASNPPVPCLASSIGAVPQARKPGGRSSEATYLFARGSGRGLPAADLGSPDCSATAVLRDPRDIVRGLQLSSLPHTSPVRTWSGGVSPMSPRNDGATARSRAAPLVLPSNGRGLAAVHSLALSGNAQPATIRGFGGQSTRPGSSVAGVYHPSRAPTEVLEEVTGSGTDVAATVASDGDVSVPPPSTRSANATTVLFGWW